MDADPSWLEDHIAARRAVQCVLIRTGQGQDFTHPGLGPGVFSLQPQSSGVRPLSSGAGGALFYIGGVGTLIPRQVAMALTELFVAAERFQTLVEAIVGNHLCHFWGGFLCMCGLV